MAKKSKSRQSKDASKETAEVLDAEVVDTQTTPTEEADIVADAVREASEKAPDADDTSAADERAPIPEEPEPVPEPDIAEPAQESVPTRPEHHDSPSNNVFLPAILGGLIAAGIGFGVAYYIIPRADPNLNENVAANATALETLQADVAAASAETPAPVDLTPVTDQITALQDQVTSEIDVLTDRIALFDERLTTLEKQPSSDGTLQESALEAYQRELDTLRTQVEEQAGAAIAQLESTRAEAAAIEKAALDAAQAAQIRAALAQIQTGLAEGVPMQAALTDLEDALGTPAPDALAAVAEGAPTLAKLQADFPNAARAALSDARAGGESGEETSAFGSFLREQLNVRSVAPREGDDADAVLSRAQAAVSSGQLQTALDEIAGLPDAAKGKLSEWVTVAETRVAAVQAAEDISLSLNVN